MAKTRRRNDGKHNWHFSTRKPSIDILKVSINHASFDRRVQREAVRRLASGRCIYVCKLAEDVQNTERRIDPKQVDEAEPLNGGTDIYEIRGRQGGKEPICHMPYAHKFIA